MKILSAVLAFSALATLAVHSAVISITRPPGILLGTPLGLDVDDDTSDDAVIRYYDLLCVSGGSVRCTNGVTIAFASNVQLFGSIDEGRLTPGFLAEGALLGTAIPETSWISAGSLTLDLIYRFSSPPRPDDGYLPYAQSLERMYVGFRIADGADYRYGYFDVQLTADVLLLNLPEFNGAYIGDPHQQSIQVSPIPEPSVIFMVIGASIFTLVRRNKKHFGEQGVAPNA